MCLRSRAAFADHDVACLDVDARPERQVLRDRLPPQFRLDQKRQGHDATDVLPGLRNDADLAQARLEVGDRIAKASCDILGIQRADVSSRLRTQAEVDHGPAYFRIALE